MKRKRSEPIRTNLHKKTAPIGELEMKFTALLDNYDTPTNRPTDKPTDRLHHKKVSLPLRRDIRRREKMSEGRGWL